MPRFLYPAKGYGDISLNFKLRHENAGHCCNLTASYSSMGGLRIEVLGVLSEESNQLFCRILNTGKMIENKSTY